jgi:hypothetical protein
MKTRNSLAAISALCILLFIVILQSCVDHTLPEVNIDECGGTVSYASQVKPIVDTSCAIAGCHNGDNGADKNWTVFTNFQSKSSNVKDRITRPAGADGHMPASGSITEDEIQTIVCWVDQGAKNN